MTTPDPMQPFPYRVQKRWRETEDTFSLELVPANGRTMDSFQPGQFNMLYHFGIGEVPISISGDPDDPDKLTHTIRAVGTVTDAMAKIRKGDVLGVRGPFGTPWPVTAAEGYDVVIVAGGIGLAPLRPAIYHILENRHLYGRVIILYGARSPEDMLYPQELHQWRGRFDTEVDVTVDQAMRGWNGRVGLVTSLIPQANFDPLETIAMICGPEIMMYYTALAFMQQGVDPTQIYVSMERNMKCAIGFCGHCQLGSMFVCKDGPVVTYDKIQPIFRIREI